MHDKGSYPAVFVWLAFVVHVGPHLDIPGVALILNFAIGLV